MKKILTILIVLLALSSPAFAQRPIGAATAGSGGGGDASAANQTTEIGHLVDIVALLNNSAAQDVDHDAVDVGSPVKIGGKASSAIPTAVAVGDRVNAFFNVNGMLGTFPTASTVGGCTADSTISTAAVMKKEIKATAGQLYELSITNIDTTPVYVKLYNDTAANTDETDTPVGRYMIPSGGGFANVIQVGKSFSTAITVRITTGIADNDTGALSANEVLLTYCYK